MKKQLFKVEFGNILPQVTIFVLYLKKINKLVWNVQLHMKIWKKM